MKKTGEKTEKPGIYGYRGNPNDECDPNNEICCEPTHECDSNNETHDEPTKEEQTITMKEDDTLPPIKSLKEPANWEHQDDTDT